MRYFKMVNDEWVECDKSDLVVGEKFAAVSEGSRLESYWGGDTAVSSRNKIVITSHSKRAIVMQGDELTVDVEIQDSEGVLIDVTDNFAIPVGKVGAGNYTTLLLQFVSGKATRSYTWLDAGEFEITQDMINMHLEELEKFDFDGFNITVAG